MINFWSRLAKSKSGYILNSDRYCPAVSLKACRIYTLAEKQSILISPHIHHPYKLSVNVSGYTNHISFHRAHSEEHCAIMIAVF